MAAHFFPTAGANHSSSNHELIHAVSPHLNRAQVILRLTPNDGAIIFIHE